MKDKDILTAKIDCNGNQTDHDVTKGAVKILKAHGFKVEWNHSRNGEHDWHELIKILLLGEKGKKMTFREIMLGTN